MVQIIPKVPGFGEKLGAAIGGGLGGGVQQGMNQAQKFSHEMQLQKAKQKEDKNIEKAHTLQSMQGTIAQLKSMAENDVSGIGIFGQWDPTPEAQQNRGKFQTLSSELLSFYKTLFPRGITQQEFIRLERDYIPKPGEATNKMVGKLNGFVDLIERKLKEYGSEENGKEASDKKGKMKFNSSHPEHKAKAEQLFKKYGDKEKVREILKREYEGL